MLKCMTFAFNKLVTQTIKFNVYSVVIQIQDTQNSNSSEYQILVSGIQTFFPSF